MAPYSATSHKKGHSRIFDLYLKDIGRYSIPSEEETIELVKRIKKGDKVALDKLVASNLRLVIPIASYYARKGFLSIEELADYGSEAVIAAAKTFDPKRGKFSTHAVPKIRSRMQGAIEGHSKIIHVPVNVVRKQRRIDNALKDMQEKDDPRTVTEKLGISEEGLKEMREMEYEILSLDMPNWNGKGTLEERIYIKGGLKDHKIMQLREDINFFLDKLPDEDGELIKKRFGLNGYKEQTLEDIGKEEGVKKETIRQREAKALKNLRKMMNAEGIKNPEYYLCD